MIICLERGADLHTAQLMPLPLTVSCFSEIQIGFTFLVPADPGIPEKGPLNVCVRVCACVCVYSGGNNNKTALSSSQYEAEDAVYCYTRSVVCVSVCVCWSRA